MTKIHKFVQAYKKLDGTNKVLDVTLLGKDGVGYRTINKPTKGKKYQVGDLPIVSEYLLPYAMALQLLNIENRKDLIEWYAYAYGQVDMLEQALLYFNQNRSAVLYNFESHEENSHPCISYPNVYFSDIIPPDQSPSFDDQSVININFSPLFADSPIDFNIS